MALTASAAVGEEIAQETLFVAYRRWDRVSGLERPDLWVRRVAVNRCTSLWRRRQAEGRANRAHHERTPSVTLLPETDHELWEAVGRLPARQRAAVTLHYVDRLSTKEIGEILGCSASTTQTHLTRARAPLRDALTRNDDEGPL